MWQSCVCFADSRGTKRTYLCVSVFAWMVSSYIWTARRFSTVLWGKAHFSFFSPWPESCLCKWKSVECLGMLICVFFPSSLSWTEARVIPEGGTVLKYLNTFVHISLPERKSKINKSVTINICIFVLLSSVNTKSITVLKGKEYFEPPVIATFLTLVFLLLLVEVNKARLIVETFASSQILPEESSSHVDFRK